MGSSVKKIDSGHPRITAVIETEPAAHVETGDGPPEEIRFTCATIELSEPDGTERLRVTIEGWRDEAEVRSLIRSNLTRLRSILAREKV
jgi:hypothetical protein